MNGTVISLGMSLFLGAIITVMVECLFWASFKEYRSFDFIIICATANYLSNITLNISLLLWCISKGEQIELLSKAVLLGEACVVLVEYLVFWIKLGKSTLKLFVLTLLANSITYSLSFVLRFCK